MSIQALSAPCFCRCANATRPMRRLLLPGLPLVLITRYFAIWLFHLPQRTRRAQRNCLLALCEIAGEGKAEQSEPDWHYSELRVTIFHESHVSFRWRPVRIIFRIRFVLEGGLCPTLPHRHCFA